jgi:hypothetical protein
MDIGRRVDTSAIVWGALTVGAAATVYVALSVVGMSVDLVLIGVVASLGILALSTIEARKAIVLIIFLSIILNVANYTIFRVGTGAVVGTESRILTLLRLPLVFLSTLIVLFRYGGLFWKFIVRNIDITIFGTIPFLAILYSPDTLSSIQYATWFLFALLTILGLCYTTGVSIKPDVWLDKISWLMVWSYIPLTVMVLYDIPSYVGGFLRVGAGDSSVYAFTCPVVLVAILVIERHKNNPGTKLTEKAPVVLLLLLVAVNALPIVLSAKRSAIVGVVLAIVIYLLANRSSGMNKRTSTFIRTMMVVLTIAAIGWTFISQADLTLRRFDRLVDPGETDNSFAIRQQIWETSVNLILNEFPLFGVGLNNGKIATAEYAYFEEGAGEGLHSTFLAIFVEMGGVGLLLFLILAIRSLRIWKKRWPQAAKWNLVILALPPLLISLTEYNLVPGQALFWPLWIVILLPRAALAHDLKPTGEQKADRSTVQAA